MDMFEGSDLCNFWRELVESLTELPVSSCGALRGGVSGIEPVAPFVAGSIAEAPLALTEGRSFGPARRRR